MTRLISFLSLGFAAACFPHIAAAQSATLEPGFYDVTAVVTLGGNPLAEVELEECVRAESADKTLEDMLSGLNKDKSCPTRNAEWTASTVRADYTCDATDSDPEMHGTIEAAFGPDFLTTTAIQSMGRAGDLNAHTKIKRKGECPTGWVNKNPFE